MDIPLCRWYNIMYHPQFSPTHIQSMVRFYKMNWTLFKCFVFFAILVNPSKGGIRKYVFWCCVCGGLATILGSLFLAVYFLLRSYTSTLGYFETIPTFVPAAMVRLSFIALFHFFKAFFFCFS